MGRGVHWRLANIPGRQQQQHDDDDDDENTPDYVQVQFVRYYHEMLMDCNRSLTSLWSQLK